jgi:ketosteroid isomerase-like protein
MTPSENKRLLQDVFAETAKGNGRPFVGMLAEDVAWTVMGTTSWSRTYHGKKAVLAELLGPLNAQLANGNTITAHRFIAEDDCVVVEGRGHNTTKTGSPYANTYCWIFRFAGGKVVELIEYTDTALIEAALQPPQHLNQPS